MNDLFHYGTKGQKWYHRLYQYKDGSLTPLGRLRYRKNPEIINRSKEIKKETRIRNIENKNRKKAEEKERQRLKYIEKNPKKAKAIKMMTADELKQRLSRLDLEKQYMNAMKSMVYADEKESIKNKIGSLKTDLAYSSIEKLIRAGVDKAVNTGVEKIRNYDDKNEHYYRSLDISSASVKELARAKDYFDTQTKLLKSMSTGDKSKVDDFYRALDTANTTIDTLKEGYDYLKAQSDFKNALNGIFNNKGKS